MRYLICMIDWVRTLGSTSIGPHGPWGSNPTAGSTSCRGSIPMLPRSRIVSSFCLRDVNPYQLHLVSPRVVLSVFHLLTCLELYEGVQSQPDSLSSPGSHGWRVSQEPEPVVSNVKYTNTYGGNYWLLWIEPSHASDPNHRPAQGCRC